MEELGNSRGYWFDEVNHIHYLDGKPLIGTSGVTKILSIPISWWASGLAVKEFGVSDPKVLTKIKKKQASLAEITELRKSIESKLQEIKTMSSAAYFDLVDRAYRAHDSQLRKSADDGTDLHADLERFVKDQIEEIEFPLRPYPKKIQPFINWYREKVKKPLWSEMHCYSKEYWLGGISDFGFIDNEDMFGIMDFKSSKAAYLPQFWQCSGYDIEISENGGYLPDGTQIFKATQPVNYYSILPFGMEVPVPQFNYDTESCKDAFRAALHLYQKLPRD